MKYRSTITTGRYRNVKVKNDGKNTCALILPEDTTEIERKRKREFDLKRILDRGGLYLAYQREVYLETGEIIDAEALLRREHPELGNILSVEFIPVTEETGMINKIGKWSPRKPSVRLRNGTTRA